jgi:hypothetical protein
MGEAQPQPTLVLGDKVWCPFCTKHIHLVRVTTAARSINVPSRTVYNLVKRKKVFGLRIAQSRTLRVCTSCLDAHDSADQQDGVAISEVLEVDS